MAKSTDPDRPVKLLGRAPREVTLSGRLTRLAGEAETGGFPCTAEHLRHLAGYVLDEAATKYGGQRPELGDGEAGLA